MRFLLDTSVLVAAMVEAHPMHITALPWLRRAKDRLDSGLVAAHSVAELYAILTTLPWLTDKSRRRVFQRRQKRVYSLLLPEQGVDNGKHASAL